MSRNLSVVPEDPGVVPGPRSPEPPAAPPPELTAPRAGTLHLRGDLDVAAADQVCRRLLEQVATDASPVVVLDLAGVTFMDCAGVDVLLAAQRWLQGQDRTMVLRATPPQVERLLGLVRLLGCEPLPDRLVESGASTADVSTDRGPADVERHRAEATELQASLRRQAAVDQSKGLLMAVHGYGPEDAMTLLDLVSRSYGVDVSDIADGLVATASSRDGGAELRVLDPRTRCAVRAALGTRGWEVLAPRGRVTP